MMYSFQQGGRGLRRQTDADDPGGALWIDLFRPHAEHAEVVSALGIDVPSLADMEEIEISNRLYRDEGADVMTVVLPGQTPEGGHIAGPVSFILSQERLVTVRHHSPRAFDTFPDRADRSAAGCGTADRVFLGLLEEIVARQADLLEGVGRALDGVSGRVLGGGGRKPEALQAALEEIGHQGEMINRVRLALLTMERALSFFGQTLGGRHQTDDLREIVQAQVRDIQSLAVPECRCDDGDDQSCAEQYGAHRVGGDGTFHAADDDRLDLRDELLEDAGTVVERGLSACPGAYGRDGLRHLGVLQMAPLAVTPGRFSVPRPWCPG